MYYPILIDTDSGTIEAEIRREVRDLEGRLGALLLQIEVTANNGAIGPVTMQRRTISEHILFSTRCNTWSPCRGITGLAMDVAAVRRHLMKAAFLGNLIFPVGASTQSTGYVFPFVDMRSPALDGECNASDLEEVSLRFEAPTVEGLTVTGVRIGVYALTRPGARIVPVKTSIREYSINDHEQKVSDMLVEDCYICNEPVDRTIDVYRGGVQLGRPAPMSEISYVVEGLDDPDYHVATSDGLSCVATVYPPHEIARLREGPFSFSVVGGSTWSSDVRLIIAGREPVVDRDVKVRNPVGAPMTVKGVRGGKELAAVPPRIRWYTPIRIGR